MANERTPAEEHVDEVTRRNAEESRKLIEQRKQRGQHAAADEELRPRGPGDGERLEQAPPGQTDVSSGGTSGPNFAGGSSKRHKPN